MLYQKLLLILASFIIGFFVGKARGEKKGIRQGMLLTPLLVRKKSLEEGECLLCNKKVEGLFLSKEEKFL
ncbi:hypothetical protein MWH28_10010 [Natroniella sulfidigena]|uniref:hypothetical protein n=1 Tax=Natroniella sulfidigena TaxID=723921 RepID=UPI00200A6E11|nr:hypothetical protein [Natroniella sulfidigena]MCK8817693.1 hypothetical protein [Natroniella sulfidigena]